MNKLIQSAKQFMSNEEGVTAIEYALIAALIAVAIIGAVGLVGDGVKATFDAVAAKLPKASS